MAAVIVYGSLYPFGFRHHSDPTGALATLLRTWNNVPGRGDFLANILLYVPLGFFGALALSIPNRWLRFALVALFGMALSTCVEIAQYYDPGRDPSLTDVYSNTLGTVLGAGARLLIGAPVRWPLQAEIRNNPAPALLLIAWLGYRLYPYVPTIDLHKYWDALKPVVLTPQMPPYALFRYTIMWCAVATLIEMLAGRRRWSLSFLALAGFTLGAKVLVLGRVVTAPELLGGAIAYLAWLQRPAEAAQRRVVVAAALLALLVVMMRLEPFYLADHRGTFGWIPFRSFLSGSIAINVQSFFEKMFYYGALIWLTATAGLGLGRSTLLVACGLFVTSLVEIYLPGRSAELTDAVMALMIGGIFALLRRHPATSMHG